MLYLKMRTQKSETCIILLNYVFDSLNVFRVGTTTINPRNLGNNRQFGNMFIIEKVF